MSRQLLSPINRILIMTICGVVMLTGTIAVQSAQFKVTEIAAGLEHPWAIAFLPDGDMLVTERPGQLRRVSAAGVVSPPLNGLPKIAATGQGGLLDVVLHPEFEKNQLVYIAYSARKLGAAGTDVARGRLVTGGLEDVEVIFSSTPKSFGGRHFGSRMLFDDKGLLYVTVGDRGKRDTAQDLSSHNGSVMRLNDDGSAAADNPFVDTPGALPEIFSFGHRNPQGMTRDPATGRIWIHEHGPQGGDEVNLLQAGANYGWPIVTFGQEYGGGDIGEGTSKQGLNDPAWVWVPSIAPSGLAFYTGSRIKQWQGKLIGGALKYRLLVSLTLDGEKVIDEKRFLEDKYGRIRDVRQGPEGAIYLLTDSSDGRILKLE